MSGKLRGTDRRVLKRRGRKRTLKARSQIDAVLSKGYDCGGLRGVIESVATSILRLPAIAFLGLFALAACAGSGESNKLAVWTKSLAASQPDGPELIVFKRGKQRLVFVGVKHDSDPTSSTHRLIASTFGLVKTRVVIVEGVPTSWGYNPAHLTQMADEKPDAQGLLASGETFPTVSGALQSGSKLLGGEPSDTDVRRIATELGVTDQDLLGFYVLRVVPQWVSQKKFDDLRSSAASGLINQQLDRSRKELALNSDLLRNADEWRRWRLSQNPGADSKMVNVEEAGPLADGPWPTSRIAASISRARDTHLYEVTKAQLAEYGSVMVIYGGSHALIQYPALRALLGRPCYRGAVAQDVPYSCRT